METKKCHLCDTTIYPGEKRCVITIHIFLDQDDDLFLESFRPSEDCTIEECMDEASDREDLDLPGDSFQEANIVLCSACQDRFLKNTSVQENILFLGNENDSRTIH